MSASGNRPSICFVTNELYPLRKGGIGRMLYNFARQNSLQDFPADIHFLIPPDLAIDEDDATRLNLAMSGIATVHVATPLHLLLDAEAHLFDRGSHHPWSLELLVSTSYRYYRALLDIEAQRGRPFDFVEFPDFGGWGFASVEAKRAGLAFRDTMITARLHSTQGIMSKAERFTEPWVWSGILMDAERHLLAHADLIVGHVQSVIDVTAEHYGLEQRWSDRTRLEFPAILLEDQEQETTKRRQRTGDPDFVFSSRLQQIKRPDIFVRAAAAFLSKHPNYGGRFRLISYGWDETYINWINELVPDYLRGQIEFVYDASAEERIEALATSIVVIPSDFESLCLFAFEVSEMERPVILNGRCPAFGDNPRWTDGNNCLLFDGSTADLVRAMEDALSWRPSEKASVEADRPYWLDETLAVDAPDEPEERATLSVVFRSVDDAEALRRQLLRAAMLESALDLSGGDKLVVEISPGLMWSVGEVVKTIRDRGWTVVETVGEQECPETFRHRLIGFGTECVLVCREGYDIYPDFVSHGLRAMTLNPDVMICGAHVAVDDKDTGRVDTLRAFGGEMPSLGMVRSRTAPTVSILRRSLLERREFDTRAGRMWFEAFFRDCAVDGEVTLIAPVSGASLSGQGALESDGSQRLSGGIIDRAGLRSGVPGRLLVLDPVSNKDATFRAPRILRGRGLADAHRIMPSGVVREFEPVTYLHDRASLMVHPLIDSMTIAAIEQPNSNVSRIVVTARNIRDDNEGVEAAVACLPRSLNEAKALASLQEQTLAFVRFPVSEWQAIAGGEAATWELSVQSVPEGGRLLLMTRLPEGASEAFAHLVFESVELW